MGKPFAGAANATLHFIEHEQNISFGAQAAQFLEKGDLRRPNSALTLNGL